MSKDPLDPDGEVSHLLQQTFSDSGFVLMVFGIHPEKGDNIDYLTNVDPETANSVMGHRNVAGMLDDLDRDLPSMGNDQWKSGYRAALEDVRKKLDLK